MWMKSHASQARMPLILARPMPATAACLRHSQALRPCPFLYARSHPTTGLLSLRGKSALVTGGNGALGLMIALGLRQAGARVTGAGRNPD